MKIDFNSGAHRGFSLVADACWFGILWAVCSLPVVTAGASTAALCRMCFSLKEDKATGTGAFFRAFRENFRQATVIWLLELATVVTLLGSRVLLRTLPPAAAVGANGAWVLFFVLSSVLFFYAIPTAAYFANSTWNTLKNAFVFGMHRPLTLLPMAVTAAIPLGMLLYMTDLFIFFLPLWIMVWPGLAAYADCLIIRKTFLPFVPQEAAE